MARSSTIKPWMLWTALIIIAAFLIFPGLSSSLSTVLSGTGPKTGGNFVSVTKPIQFTCFDALSGSNCGAVTVKVFRGVSLNSGESLTASAAGVATTGNAYTTGTSLTIGISGNSKVTEYIPFTVPGMDPNSAISSTNNIVVIYAVTLGAWNIVITGNNGATTFVSGSQYGLSTYSGNTVTLTVTAGETTNNAGYKTSYDITNLLNQYMVFEINDGGGASSSTQYATVSGLPRVTKLGNTNYYQVICPDGLISNFGFTQVATGVYVSPGVQSSGSSDSICTGSWSLQSVGTQTFGGTVQFSFSIALGSLSTGNVETFQFKIFDYYDPAYFVVNQNGGANAAQQGSTFTIKFNK